MPFKKQKIETIKQAIKWLGWCRTIHWRYTKNPKWCRGNLGSVTHHQHAVDKYDEIIKLLRRAYVER